MAGQTLKVTPATNEVRMNVSIYQRGWPRHAGKLVLLSLVGLFSQATLVPAADVIDRIRGPFVTSIYASNLKSPDGMAFHPITTELYVVEEDGADVKVIRDGRVISALEKGWTIDSDIPNWAIKAEKTLDYWTQNRLRSPEGLAFSTDGHMFVTEDIADGRLLEFIPDEDGSYSTARAIPIPWMDKKYEWESVVIARDGRLFIAGSSSSYGPGLFFGSVLMRDAEKVWWAVDYAPFASFSVWRCHGTRISW